MQSGCLWVDKNKLHPKEKKIKKLVATLIHEHAIRIVLATIIPAMFAGSYDQLSSTFGANALRKSRIFFIDRGLDLVDVTASGIRGTDVQISQGIADLFHFSFRQQEFTMGTNRRADLRHTHHVVSDVRFYSRVIRKGHDGEEIALVQIEHPAQCPDVAIVLQKRIIQLILVSAQGLDPMLAIDTASDPPLVIFCLYHEYAIPRNNHVVDLCGMSVS